MRHFEQSLRAVESAGPSDEATFDLIALVDDYVFGFALRKAQDMDEDPDESPRSATAKGASSVAWRGCSMGSSGAGELPS